MEKKEHIKEFWDNTWSSDELPLPDVKKVSRLPGKSNRLYLEAFGDVKGKTVLDLGCGNGLLSVWLALEGAQVTAVDISATAIDSTIKLALINNVSNKIHAEQLNAMDLGSLEQDFDLVVGRFILHHIEPFKDFIPLLVELIKPGGKGVFLENNARNRLLMFVRTHFAGKYGIPKFGDPDEYPFDPSKATLLSEVFEKVTISYPEFLCFGLIAPYILKDNRRAKRALKKIDNFIYKNFHFLHRYSYRQVIVIEKACDNLDCR